jgi:RHS repeat-associated protein
MYPTQKSTKTGGRRNLAPASSRMRRLVAQTLVFILLAQAVAPPALAAPAGGSALAALAGRASSKFAAALGVLTALGAGAAKPSARAVKPSAEDFGLVLTPLGTPFGEHVGIDHHEPLRKVVVSSNQPTGVPLNFESLDADGTHRPYSNVAGLTGELKFALARGGGATPGGFAPGEMFTGTGVQGVVARLSADGSAVQNPWVTLPGEGGLPHGGLWVDRTGVFGGDLVVVTTTGGVWRVNAAGAAARVADLGTHLEGVTTVPDDVTKYGPWAGKILVGAKEQSAVYAIDAQGNATSYQLGLAPQDIRVIPAHENFYGVDPLGRKIWGAPDDAFTGIIGDILVAQGTPGVLARVRWNGSDFEVGQIAEVASWGQTTFSPAALAEVGGVKQFYDKIAVVRHAPQLDSGRVEGALWQLLPEDLALGGTSVITSDLLVPGTPTVTVGGGRPSFGGVIQGVESPQPTGYSVSISNNASLRHVITRTNPITLSPVNAPPAPAGTRDVSLSRAGSVIGDPSTLRHLSISGKAGAVAVPPGTYGRFSAGGHTHLVLGVEGSNAPAVYNLEELSLSGGSELRLAGPVSLNVRGNVSLSGSTVGAADDPRRLTLSVSHGALGVNGGGVLYAVVRIPRGAVAIGGNGRVRGTVTSDRLNVYGNGVLQITENDVPPPPINRPPAADAGPDQTITLPTDAVSLNGAASDDGLPAGSTLATKWTKLSGPGPVVFADPGSAVTTATFDEPGLYTLRLTANDSLLTDSDEMTVEVVPRNQPPVVNAGPDQVVELPNAATLAGTVTDDALPRGSTVTKTWSVVSGPGAAAFADPHDLATAVSFAAPGVYTLRLTADDTEFTVSDEVVVTVDPENRPPVVNAGPDQTVRLPTPVTLNGTASDDGLPRGSALTTKWTKVSGPGLVTFANDALPATAATFGAEGTYVLRLTADDTRSTASDECVVTVLPRNAPPVVNAGPDGEITFLEAATLNGAAADDGLPVGSVLEVAWSQVSGPGTATFASPSAAVTAATFSAPGTYVLRLTADDSQFGASDEATVVVKPRPHASRVYTLDGDFDEGSLINVAHGTADQLQLDSTTRSFNFIWVAVSTKGTIVKINTETGAIIGEYHTAPAGQPTDPSRTTVDQNGNVWATNRSGNSVVHVGLAENGQCVDRNGNGVIDTSTGFNDIRPWTNAGGVNTNGGVSTAQDECVIHYTRVNSFGTRHVSVNKDNDIWVSGTSGQRFDLVDGKTGLIKRAENSVGFGGYGGLIDRNNVIWSAAPMLWWDTSKPLSGQNGTNWRGYGHPSYGLCIDSQGNVYNTSYGNGTINKFAPNGTHLGSFNQGSPWAQGCVVDRKDHIWVAHSLNANTVGHLKSDGTYVGTVTVGSGPTGVAVDGAGKIWATNYFSGTVSRISPALGPVGGDGVTRVGAVDFTTPFLGGNPYNYSDMTGSTLTGAPNNGTWSVVFDSQTAGAEWGRVGWTAQVCGDGLLTMSVATSENNANYSQPVAVSNGDDPAVPNGRYARITVRFERASSGESPVLYDLSIGTVGFPLGTPSNVAPGVDAGADQTLNGTNRTALRASVCDDALPSNRRLALNWAKVSGPGTAAFAKPNSPATDVTFSAPGTYTLRLTANDSAHASADTVVVTVIPGNSPPVVSAGPDRTVAFVNDAASFVGDLAKFNAAAGSPPVAVDFDNVAPGTEISGQTFAGVRFERGNSPSPSAPLVVVRGSETFTPAGFSTAPDPAGNRLLPTSGENVLSPGGTRLAPGPNPQLENDDIRLSFPQPVSAVGFDILFQSLDCCSFVSVQVLNAAGQVVYTNPQFPTGSAAGGVPGGSVFFGFVSPVKDIAAVVINDFDDTADFPDSNIGIDTVRVGTAVADSVTASLNGAVTDDGLPAGSTLTATWSKLSGPGLVAFGNVNHPQTTASFNVAGTYVLRLEATDTQKGAFDDVTVTVQPRPNRPPEITSEPATEHSLPAATYTYDAEAFDPDGEVITYSLAAAPQGMTVNPSTGLVTWPVTVASAGDHAVTLRVQDARGAFDTQSFTLSILKQNQPPAVSAGADRSISVNATATLGGTVNDDGLPRNAAVNSSWEMVSGPGLVTFADPSSPSTTATFSEAGVYVLRLSASDTLLAASDETVITVTPPNKAPAVSAGADQTVTLPGAARLGGAASDDGLPAGGALSLAWTKVSGPGAATFASPSAAATTVTFGEAGTYVLRLSASDSELTSTDDVTVTVNPFAPNQAPVVNAGADPAVQLNLNLVRNPGNDEQLLNGEIPGWTEAVGGGWTLGLSGANGFPESVNGGGFFYAGETASAELRQDVDVSAFAATIAAGTQSFEWRAFVRSRAESAADTARVIFEYRNASNTAMIARLDSGEVSTTTAWHLLEDTRPAPAGTGWVRIRLIATRRSGATNDAYFDGLSLRAVTGAGVKLVGTVADDGLPASGTLSTNWTKVSGPGAVAFADASAASTSATFAEAGTYVLRLSASDSELNSADELTVTVEPRNLAPSVEAGADQTVTLPATASLGGTVGDDGKPSGSAVTSAWTKVSGPGNVAFADAGAPNTSATFAEAGTYVLRLTASDTEYSGSDIVTVVVKPVAPNTAPAVNAGADQVVNPPAAVAALSGTATDDGQPRGIPLTYSWTKVSGPGNVTFGSPSAAATTATFGAPGAYVLRLSASDSELTGTDDVRVTFNGTNKAPTANAGPDQTLAHPTAAALGGAASDDGLPLDSTLSFGWAKVSGPGTVTFANASAPQTTATFGAPGVYVLRLTASDSELTAADDVTVTQAAPPTAAIISPAEGATVTGRTDFVGTVSEGSAWRLEHSLNEEGTTPVWTTIAAGSAPVTNGVLGTFDPTLLLNGIYTVRLVATDAAGQTTTTSVRAVAEGEQKVGNFRVSFTDLSVPLAGIPIEVIRTYDSRDKRAGDFGVGWTLDVRNMRLQESVEAGLGWEATVTPGFLPNYCIQPKRSHAVSVTMPNNEVLRFEAVPTPQCSRVYPPRETTIGYRAMPGTYATLAPVGEATVYVNASFPGDAELLDYNTLETKDFNLFRLTLPNGAEFLIDQRAGLREATDANGNKLTIGSGGITHSGGQSVAFARDAQGRITRVTDPAGNSLAYAYDARGDLVSFRDRESNETTYSYNSNHDLLTIKDPRGLQPVRNEYDASGRLVRQIDASGKVVNFAHDLNTRQEVTTDRLGNTTVHEYNARGQIVRITDASGGVTTRAYDGRDNLIRETNSEGQTLSYTYDAQDNKLTETDALGNTTRYTYDGRRQVLTVTDPQGRVTTNTYDADGNLTSVRDPLGNTAATTYDQRGLPLTATDALGNVTRFEYSAAGHLTRQTDALGRAVTFTHDANGNTLSETTTRTVGGVAETVTNTFEYDRSGRRTRVAYPNGSAAETSYNSLGHPSAQVDMLGRRTTYDYDDLGRLFRINFPDGKSEEFELDAEGRRLKRTDRAGRVTRFQYDALGQLVRTTFPDGTSASTAYNTLGQPVALTDAAGRVSRFEYDAAGRRTKATDAAGNVMTFAHDAEGRETSMTDPKGNVTRFEYDAAGRRTRVVYPDGTSAATAHDAQGRVSAQTDQAGRTTRFEYDGLGKVTKVTDARGGVTRYTYDERGDMLTQTDANNHTTTFEYDRLGLRVRRTLPLGMSETYGYDAGGRLASRTDFGGRTTAFAYDAMGRLVSKTPDPSLGEPAVTYTYNEAGRRATMTDASGTTRYDYDARDRLTSKQTPQGTLAYTYDASGNLLTLRSSNAEGVSADYAYDSAGRLSSVTDNRQPQGAGATRYAYDANGNLESTHYPNGVRTSYAYNTLNRLTNVTAARGSTVASYAYTLGAAGNRLSVTEHTGRTVGYTYDELYRLTGETIANDAAGGGAINYTYDAVGNRLSRVSTSPAAGSTTSTYDANDRLTADAYDANGNTVSAGGTAYAYDFENRLAGVGGGAVSYVYDGDGNRVAKTVGGVTTRYLVDTNNPTGYAQVVEELEGGAVTRQYTYGHDLVSQRRLSAGQWLTSFYGYDGHGSVRQLTDAGGAVTDTYDYDAFGNLIGRTGSTPNEYLYAGERFDHETGLYYLRARHMNPSTGRFWTMDWYEGRALEPLSLHKYLYAHADPVNNIDPTGNFSIGEMSSVQGMINTLSTITRAINTFMRVVNGVRTFVNVLNYVTLAGDILAALGEPTPALVKSAVAAALRRQFGSNIGDLAGSFQQVVSSIGPNWPDIANSLGAHAPAMAREIFPEVAKRLPKMLAEEKLGKLKMIFYAPTGPGPRKDTFIEVKKDLLLAVGLTGGRLFGVGVKRANGMEEQIFRVDYWDGRLPPLRPTPTPLHVHYHVYSDKHPPNRTIWP